MKRRVKTFIGLAIFLSIVMLFCSLPCPAEMQTFQSPLFHLPLSTPDPPQRPEIALHDATGETARWARFTDPGFILRYPSDWQARVLPDQIAGTRIVEFTHSMPDGQVDAAIQVWETRLSSDGGTREAKTAKLDCYWAAHLLGHGPKGHLAAR